MLPEEPVRINIRRKTMWDDFRKERKRKIVVFLGEPAINDGVGPADFFSGLLPNEVIHHECPLLISLTVLLFSNGLLLAVQK